MAIIYTLKQEPVHKLKPHSTHFEKDHMLTFNIREEEPLYLEM